MMKRAIYTLLALVAMPVMLMAETLVDMTSAIEALGSYEVTFAVESEGQSMEGYYAVDGDRYYFMMDSQEIYGDPTQRCVINHATREVVLELVDDDTSAPMIVTNPIQAFTMLGGDCDITKVDKDDEKIVIHLTPRSDDGMVSSSIMEVDARSNLPISVTYLSDSESVKISVGGFMPLKKDLSPRYSAEYEVIDIR